MRAVRSLSVILGLGLTLLLLQACGGSDSLNQAAAPVDGVSDANDDPASAGDEKTNTSITDATAISFGSDVQPILEENCVSCHSDNGPGTPHLEMQTAADVASIADFIAFRVDERQMPPWPISPLTEIAFEYDLSMTDADRQVIIDWEAAGAPLDVDDSATLTASNVTYSPIDADVVLTAAEAYPGADALDDYRCQVYDPEVATNQWVTGIDVRPDETQVLHHAVIFFATSEQRKIADEKDGADGRPGWTCQTIPRLGTGGLVSAGAWAPGSNPLVAPENAGWVLDPGDFVVVQWHYHYDGVALADNSGLGLQFASAEQVAAAGGDFRPVDTEVLLGPVEIPCATFESGPLCDRDAAIERIGREFGVESMFIPDFVNARCGVGPEDFADMVNGFASSSCDYNPPDGEIINIWPHMHELGTTYRMTLNPDTPEAKVLVDIDRWNFDWQMSYDPIDMLMFAPGDTLRIECGWDRSLWPAGVESRYVVWAEGTQDEMCYTSLAVLE